MRLIVSKIRKGFLWYSMFSANFDVLKLEILTSTKRIKSYKNVSALIHKAYHFHSSNKNQITLIFITFCMKYLSSLSTIQLVLKILFNAKGVENLN